MNRPTSRWARRISTGVLVVLLPALAAAHPAAADEPPAADRTLPNLGFVCPAAIGDHRFAGLLPDGPLQEQCFFEDSHGSSFAVGVSWATRAAEPGDSRAQCVEPARTSWHEDGSGGERRARFSGARRANAYVALNLYWPTTEKLARQRDLLDRSEALGDQMLAAAEKRAQPCFPATPTASPSSDPAWSSGSPSPSDPAGPGASPGPSPTDAEPPCAAGDGRLTDNGGHPVEGVVVRLSVTGQEPVDAATDAQGRFHFDGIPDTESARASDAARLRVLVRDGDGTWRSYAGSDEATLTTRPFALTEADGCRHDLTTRSLDGYESANPAEADDWADLWAVVTRTRRALAYATTELGVALRDVPVAIYAWCPPSLHRESCTPDGDGAFAFERTPTAQDRSAGLGGTGRVPYLALASGLTRTLAEKPEDDAVYHELGHVLQADLAGGFTQLLVDHRTNHAGYANASSNDSWVEGFASWFAMSVRLADGRRRPYFEWHNGARLDVEHDVKAWDGNGKHEEWAVAGLLTDLTDRGVPTGEQGEPVPFTVTGNGWARLIRGTAKGAEPDKDVVVVDLYDTTGTLVGSDEAYLFPDGRFLDVPSVEFAGARVFVRPAGGSTGEDDDPFAMSPRTVVRLVTGPPDIGTRGGRRGGSSMVFDMAELHSVLRSTLRRPEDVDALFVAHGFHENPDNLNTYADGAAVGMTTHLPFHRLVNPRYDARILPAQFVEVDTGGVDATVVVFPQHGVPYTATPDAERRVPVMIPGSRDARAAVVTVANGSRPAVTVIEGEEFWPEAAKHDGPFLTIQPKLEPVSATRDNGPDTTTAGAGAMLVGLGAGAALLGLAGGAALLRVRRRRRRAGPPTPP